ncbi:S4 RNA-binding domain-containing protein [Mycena indigotica]|uniref:S4 RNA-binding domain-containing protein n=1 Tax=Mycena indigotica TaxID=2126181 RepID=A0A8H6SPR8_9AGAR|nr:S4 RNA-binding domain-containing protein [Mycena indigotica]KAF7303755.1 S4 RNA-binding domain-containing protein [Mycena indigotica]
MRDKGVFAIRKALPRMVLFPSCTHQDLTPRQSWHPKNLFNLHERTAGSRVGEIDFKRSEKKLFQQRWISKSVVRAYHGDLIGEKIFKSWYLPESLPDVRPRRKVFGDDGAELTAFARRSRRAEREKEREEEEKELARGLAPIGSLMFGEVERRLDVLIFRCCFAPSIYEARRLVIHGNVLLNGRKHSNANTRLAPGDMFSVRPSAIKFLQPQKKSDESDNITERLKAPVGSTPFNLPFFASPWLFIPAYLEVSFLTCSAIYVRHPTARPQYSEIPTPYDADGEVVRAAWEWYMQNRSRKRTEKQWSRMPDDRLHPQMQERRLGSNSIRFAIAQATRNELR